MSREWVTVVPAEGEIQATAQLLLELAEDHRHVLTQGSGVEFVVPPYLADAYQARRAPKRRTRKTTEKED